MSHKLINQKAALVLFFFGAVLGSVFDGFHTYSGTTAYAHPLILKMAWWVPFLFGGATLAIGDSHVRADAWLKRPPSDLSWVKVFGGLVIFGVVYYASGFLPSEGSFKEVIVLSGAVLLWIFFEGSWQGLFLGALTGVVGSLVEIILIHLGFFHYAHPDRYGIPFWLPGLYFGASVAVGNLGRKIHSSSL